ncbi:MAG: V4R domain-containing protein [Burkholderiales bacterium]|nr:hypothetical protein [Burkholderiales bacterium]
MTARATHPGPRAGLARAPARGAAAASPACDDHAAAFERLWRALLSPRAWVVEAACCACGAPACRFELRRPR